MNIGWQELAFAIGGFLIGNLIKPMFGELSKDLYGYYFRDGKNKKKLAKEQDLLLKFLMENKRKSFTLEELRSSLLNKREIYQIEEMLRNLKYKHSKIRYFSADDITTWSYFE